SQSHLGQILDEYAIDRDAMSQLQALSGFQPAHRAEALRILAAAYPEHVAVAASLMVALREAGRFDYVQPREIKLKIPKVIAQFWDAEEPPEDVARLMASWGGNNPDYDVRCFSLHTAASFLQQSYPAPVLRAFLRPMEPAKRADLFRLAWLYKAGGIYADADDLCLAPLASVLPASADMVLYQEEYGTVGNNFIATAPNNPMMKYALDQAVIAINRGDADILWLATGPGLLTRALAQQIYTQGAVPRGLAVMQRHELNQAVAPHCKVRYKKTPLHWTKSSFNARAGRVPPHGVGGGNQPASYTTHEGTNAVPP
ncbi:glycosyltransferase family 32 protein, partial [Acidocella sp.]|uniref:glycosyltransferase family 32 protein n=1 Tax=Acidocella sp. TaxID=50710 RepID=UPI00262C9FDC